MNPPDNWEEIYMTPTSRTWQSTAKDRVITLHMGLGSYWVGRSPIDRKFSGPYKSFEAARAAAAAMEG